MFRNSLPAKFAPWAPGHIRLVCSARTRTSPWPSERLLFCTQCAQGPSQNGAVPTPGDTGLWKCTAPLMISLILCPAPQRPQRPPAPRWPFFTLQSRSVPLAS